MNERLATLAGFSLLVALGSVLRFSSPGTFRDVPSGPKELLASVARVRPGAGVVANQRRGYYENLAGAARLDQGSGWDNPPESYRACVDGPKERGGLGPILDPVGDWRNYRYTPSLSMSCFDGVPWRTNRFGFRGPEWADAPAPGVVRIAVLGGSHVTGFGLPVEQSFPARLEALLNRAPAGARYEIINLSVTGYAPHDQVKLMDEVLAFSPQVILYVSVADVWLTQNKVRAKSARNGLTPAKIAGLPPTLRALRDEAQKGSPGSPAVTALSSKIVIESFRLMAEAARKKNVTLFWANLPDIGQLGQDTPPFQDEIEAGARAAGFQDVDITDVFSGYDLIELWVHDYDAHPSAVAHELIAGKLAKQLTGAGPDGRPLLPIAPPLPTAPAPGTPGTQSPAPPTETP